MAIFVEEEKQPVNWLLVIGIIVVAVVVFLGGYYVFFQQPELIEVIVPQRLQALEPIARVKFNPSDVIGSTAFKLLRDYSSPLTLPQAGRSNPFQPF